MMTFELGSKQSKGCFRKPYHWEAEIQFQKLGVGSMPNMAEKHIIQFTAQLIRGHQW